MPADLTILATGYADDRVASTVALILDGAQVIVVDPGMVASRSVILDPLAARGIAPEQVTDVVLSHHHPDHTINIALFPVARVHDFMATYVADEWIDHGDGDFAVSASVVMRPLAGHTPEDVTTMVETADGLVVLTHLWWHADGPADDPFAADREQLRRAREAVLALNPTLIVPGHGPGFAPSLTTPL
jgi:glyoxylase-like metal-dependent hydrolase (beta-lactamase superfamily II)